MERFHASRRKEIDNHPWVLEIINQTKKPETVVFTAQTAKENNQKTLPKRAPGSWDI